MEFIFISLQLEKTRLLTCVNQVLHTGLPSSKHANAPNFLKLKRFSEQDLVQRSELGSRGIEGHLISKSLCPEMGW